MQYPNSIPQLEEDLAQAPSSYITNLAARLIDGAKAFDLEKAENLGVNFQYKDLVRDQNDPPYFETEEVYLADGASDKLDEGEKWNEGKRATLTGTFYDVAFQQFPYANGVSPDDYERQPEHRKPATITNPYMNTGMRGRGCLYAQGPNHAVDNGILLMKDDEHGTPTLYALGITRKFDNDAPAFAGGFAKFRQDENGAYIFDQDAIIDTKVEEFFEEMVSGSIELTPEYRDRLPLELAREVQTRALSLRNPRFPKKPLSDEDILFIQGQMEAHLKVQQVQDKDPEFFERLREIVAGGKEAFAGPILNDNRSTNNAWIESQLSWFMMDDETWDYIKGSDPVFDYQFTAGDDASDVVAHRLDAHLIENAFASHGPMFAFMAASFILDAQSNAMALEPSIVEQIAEIPDYFDLIRNNAPSTPAP